MMSLQDAHRPVGASTTTIPIFEQFLTAQTVVPTGNQAPVYAYNSITLNDEPLVREVVPDVVGFIADVWQRPVEWASSSSLLTPAGGSLGSSRRWQRLWSPMFRLDPPRP
jgi:hypothetical protein